MNVGVVGLQEQRISVTLYTSKTYLLSATHHTADFEVIGCVPMRGEKAIRVLLLGEKHQGRLVYKGKVGSGFTRRQRQDFLAELTKAPKLQEPVDCPSGSRLHYAQELRNPQGDPRPDR